MEEHVLHQNSLQVFDSPVCVHVCMHVVAMIGDNSYLGRQDADRHQSLLNRWCPRLSFLCRRYMYDLEEQSFSTNSAAWNGYAMIASNRHKYVMEI